MRRKLIRLEADEVASLLDFVEHGGDHLTGQKLAYYEKTKERDLAIITLLLGTGIRVSELVGLNIDDVDFRNNGLHLIRKGRKEMTVYFGNEVADALEQYIEGSRNSSFQRKDMKMLYFILCKDEELVCRRSRIL